MKIEHEVQASLAVDTTIAISVTVDRDLVNGGYRFSFSGPHVTPNGILVFPGVKPYIVKFIANAGPSVTKVRFCPKPSAKHGVWPVRAGVSAGPNVCPEDWDLGEFRFIGLDASARSVELWNRNSNGAARYGYQLNFIVTHDGCEHPAPCDPRIINRAD